MGYRRCVGRVGALAVATRMTVSIYVAVLVAMATVVPASASASSLDVSSRDRTALIMGGTSIPTWSDADVKVIMNQFIAPTHPRETIEPVAVTTPEEGWPITGLIRLIGRALGPRSIFGPGGAGWPDEPWWKLSGLFDLDYEHSIQAGVADLETAMAKYGNDDLVIYGYSQGAMIAIREKRKLAEQYPAGTTAPDIDFVLSEDPNLPNGGLLARFPGFYIPILAIWFNGAEPTDTQFDTFVITRQYDGLADFPLYPLNPVADLNAVLGVVYRHLYPFDVSLASGPSTSPPIQSQHGDTTYYFFETQDLPLFDPLRTLGVPEQYIDVVEPFFRVLVELGYDRSIPPWEPTPARLIPTLDPAKVKGDLVNAIGEGITNAAALIGAPAPLSGPAPAVTADHGAAVPRIASTLERVSGDAGEGVSAVLTALGSALPKPSAVTHHDLAGPQRTIGAEPATTRDRLNAAIGTVKSVIGDGRTIVRSARGDNGSPATTARPARKTPVRDALNNASTDITKSVTKVSDSMKQAPSGGTDDSDRSGGAGAAR